MKEFRTISVDKQTYETLNRMACENERSIVGQIRWMITAIEKHYTVTKVTTLQPTPDAEPVNIYEAKEVTP